MSFTISTAAARGDAGIANAVPDVWYANQLASYRTHAVPTGHAPLDRELPDRGWPSRTLIELLAQQAGIGEMRLLLPALRRIADRPIALVQPPHQPQAAAWASDDFPVGRMMWVKAGKSADALWAAEQILRNGTCGALLFWQPRIRNESLRRLHLAAQGSDIVFWLIRPLACAQDASPAPLRMALRPAAGGISVDIVKRRGPRRADPLVLPFERMPAASPTFADFDHALVDSRSSPAATVGNVSPALV
ncbi:MAG TPA: translesion DNA synthesis-associated protein ImuA [Burkholderiaceae bacterium]|nr:translesion DNA synthesis-associated protein ImuA [Burkholderiaceae bacterium]